MENEPAVTTTAADHTATPDAPTAPVMQTETKPEPTATAIPPVMADTPEGEQSVAAKPEETQDHDYKTAIKLPEGFEMRDAWMDRATALFKENNIAPEQAQGFVDAFCAIQQEAAENARAESNSAVEAWRKEINERSEFAAELPLVRQGINSMAKEFPEIRALYNDPVFGNMPELWKIALCVGRKFGTEGDMLGAGRGNKSESTIENMMYPTMNQK